MSEREFSHLARVNRISESIKTVIPQRIARELKLGYHDVIEWRLESEKGEKFAYIRKIK